MKKAKYERKNQVTNENIVSEKFPSTVRIAAIIKSQRKKTKLFGENINYTLMQGKKTFFLGKISQQNKTFKEIEIFLKIISSFPINQI